MRDAGQTVQTQVSIWAGEDESRCWSLSCFQLWDRNLLPETNCSTFCFPQTSRLPLPMTEMISYCAGWVQPWARLRFLSSPCCEPLPTHRGIQVIKDPHTGVSLPESLDFWRHPCRWFPSSPLCWSQLFLVGLDLWDAPRCFCGSALCSCQCSRAAEAHLYFHTGWKTLSARTLDLGLAILALHHPWCWEVLTQCTMGFWPGSAAVIFSNGESLLGFF